MLGKTPRLLSPVTEYARETAEIRSLRYVIGAFPEAEAHAKQAGSG